MTLANNGLRPLRDFMSLRDAMDRLFEESFVSPGSWSNVIGSGSRYLPLEIYETPDDVVVRAHVPGVTPDALDVQYHQGMLSLRARVTTPELPEEARWHLREITAGEFFRQVTLPRPIDVDQATTTFDNGVLTLTLPKTPDAKPKQIKIGSHEQISAGSAS